MNVATYREALLQKRAELEQTAGLRPIQTSLEHNNGRQGDMADQAAGNNEVHIHLRLKQTDAKILQAIDEALQRIEKGTFGICRDCGEPIAEARLNAIPVDAGVHHLQGKAEGVNPSELSALLREFYLERLALLLRHESAARFVSDYDVNNAYQNIIAREETHVSWLQHALIDGGLELPPDPARPDVKPTRKGRDAVLELAAADGRANRRSSANGARGSMA